MIDWKLNKASANNGQAKRNKQMRIVCWAIEMLFIGLRRPVFTDIKRVVDLQIALIVIINKLQNESH